MLFDVIRIIIFLIVFVISFLIIKKSKIYKKRLATIISMVLCFAVMSFASIFPVENLFITFDSPTSVFNYIEYGNIYEILHGENSSMIIYSDHVGTYSNYIVPKTEKGYKIPTYFDRKKVSHKFDKDGAFDVYNVRGTQDYYVFCMIHSRDKVPEIHIFDGEDKEQESNIVRIENSDFIYFTLHDFTNEYYVTVSGEKILIS